MCGKTGHKARKCPNKKNKERMLAYEKESSDIEDYLSDYSGVASLF